MISRLKNFAGAICKHQGFQKYLKNTGWLFGGQMLRMVLGLFVSVAVARYLGPSDFGLYNYVLSIVALVAVLGNLGLQNLAKRELVAYPEKRDEILGTCFVLSALAGVVAYGGMLWVVAVFTDSSLVLGLFALLGGQLLTGSFRCIEVWFQSQVRSDLSVKATSISLLVYAAVKVIVIACGQSLLAFAYIFLLESITVAGLQVYYYIRNFGSPRKWKAYWSKAIAFLYRSWPLMFSALASVVYLKIDQVMLGSLLGDEAVGIYAVAVRISAVWYFVPQILSSSLFPAIFNSKKQGEKTYLKRVQQFFDLNVTLAYVISASVSVFSFYIVLILFGSNYLESAEVLAIHAWSSLFIYMGIARSQFLIAEDLFRFGLYCNIVGAAVNILLNWLLIPNFGVEGAAISTLASLVVATFLSSFIISATRRAGVMQLKAYLLPIRLFVVGYRRLLS